MQAYWKRVNEVKSTLKDDATQKWLKDSKEWMQKEFGNNVINAVVHFDEKTPHIHLLCVPMVDGKLTAKDFFTPVNAKRWQTSYARATGLKRGVASERKHEELKEQEFNAARKEGAQKGYNKYKKIGYKKGLEEGKAEGLEQTATAGAKVGGFIASFKAKFSSPTDREQQAIAEAQKKQKQAEEKQKQAEEEARRARAQADNRVAKADELLKAEQAARQALQKELLDKEQKIRELTPTRPQQQQNFRHKIK